MNEDVELFKKNYEWFENFFGDMEFLFTEMEKALSAVLPKPLKSIRYYPKRNLRPSLPAYYMLGLGGPEFAVQIFAVLNPESLELRPEFNQRLSFCVVKSSRGDLYAYPEEVGLRILRSTQKHEPNANNVISGEISEGSGKGIRFQAFNVPLKPFLDGAKLKEAIRTEVVERLSALPPL